MTKSKISKINTAPHLYYFHTGQKTPERLMIDTWSELGMWNSQVRWEKSQISHSLATSIISSGNNHVSKPECWTLAGFFAHIHDDEHDWKREGHVSWPLVSVIHLLWLWPETQDHWWGFRNSVVQLWHDCRRHTKDPTESIYWIYWSLSPPALGLQGIVHLLVWLCICPQLICY